MVSVPVRHRVPRIGGEVEESLLELALVNLDSRQIVLDLDFQIDALASRRASILATPSRTEETSSTRG